MSLVWAAVLGFQTLAIVDEDCKMLTSDKVVAASSVDLGKEEKPFRCENKGGDKVACVSSRSGQTSEFRVEREDDAELVLRYVGAGEWTAVIRVDKKAGRFQVASTRPMAEKGLTAELCIGKANLK
jgi:hypothetical protein